MKMIFKTISFIAFLATFAVFSCKIIKFDGYPEPKNNQFQENDLDFANSFSGNAWVIDGDSIKISKKNVRLLYIDAPEYKQKCFDKNNNEYDCGIVSKKYLLNLLKDQEVKCYYNNKDMYNRFLAVCYVNNVNINKKLISDGMAVIYDLSKVSDEIINLESQAKSSAKGIWQGHFQLPKEYRKMIKK